MNFLERIEHADHIETKIFEDLRKNKKEVALFGAGGAGFYLNKWLCENGITPICFIDDDVKKQEHGYMGMPVFSYEDFKKKHHDYVVFVSIANNAVRAMEGLLMRGEKHDVYYIGSRDPWSAVTNYEYVKQNCEQYEAAYNLFDEELSKKVFTNILNNKITGKVQYASEIKTKAIYFDETIVRLGLNETFLDVGACDGEKIAYNKFRKIKKA